MALPPKFAGQRLSLTANPAPTIHTLELYLDYVCPFSAKLFHTLTSTVIPAVRQKDRQASNLSIIFRQQVQPWHPSSTLVHEAALAVLRVRPDRFWDYSAALFREQKKFFDVNVVHQTRNETYKVLAALAGELEGVDEDEVYKLLAIPDKPGEDGSLNSGNGVTADLKVVTKMNRLVGIHVTPTAVLDGVVQDTSSSWDGKQWEEWLDKNIT